MSRVISEETRRKNRERSLARYYKLREELNAAKRAQYATDEDYRKRTLERTNAANKRRLQQVPEKVRAQQKTYRIQNLIRIKEYTTLYMRGRKNAAPHWLTETQRKQCQAVYLRAERLTRETGIPHDVDHIYPIKGKTVCGLHVPWNLRAIPAEENRRKHNKMPEDFYGISSSEVAEKYFTAPLEIVPADDYLERSDNRERK